jgi:outer membrane murein-binding lipoprotein Lpp
MKSYSYYFGLTVITASTLVSGCSSLTDSIAASTQTFTNTTQSSSEVSSNVSKSAPGTAQLKQAVEFAAINWMQLSANMANGEGEHLSAMADLLGVSSTQKPAFFSMTKTKFSQLLPSTETTPAQLVDSLKVELGKLGKA